VVKFPSSFPLFPFGKVTDESIENVSGKVSFDVIGKDSNVILQELGNIPEVMKVKVTKIEKPYKESPKEIWHIIVLVRGTHDQIINVKKHIWDIDKKDNNFEVKDMVYSFY
jgi:hypothetical protein